MTTLRFIAAEAWHEMRAACRGPLIPIVFPALIGYVVLVVLNADYMRAMGGTNVPRNSPHVVYLMLCGQAVWLLFAWAWLFGQAVLRDRTARLHEVVLSAPISLPALLVGRYLGVLVVACLLVLATGVGFLTVPLLGAVGLVPPEAVGPQPFFAIGHSLLVLSLPSAAGSGALFLCAAIRTRGLAGPFAVATVVMLVWMVAMVLLRGGDANPALATFIDPSGFSEVEEQTVHQWTPREKAVGVLELTPLLVANRVLWSVPPLILLAVVLRRVRREPLAVESAPAAAGREGAAAPAAAASGVSGAPLGVPTAPSWVRAAWNETAWHLRLALRGWGTPLALFILVVAGAAGTFVNIVMHADGPFLARPALIGPTIIEFFYLSIVFMVAGFVGVMARRDDRPGYGEIADATPAPLGSRVAGLSLAAAAVTVLFSVAPALSVWILSLLAVPEAFSLLDPLLSFGLVLAPSLLELCALVLLAHALVRHAGAAHAVGIICAFVVVINSEVGVTTYPPALVGIPPQVTLSEFTGWAPWLGHVLTADLFKLAVAAAVVALAWVARPRGTALTAALRWRAGAARLAGGAGVLAAAAVLLALGTHRVLHRQLVTGGYETSAAAIAGDAAWEGRWWAEAAPFAVTGGEAAVEIDPAGRRAVSRWQIEGVRSWSGTLHGSLPDGAEIRGAAVNGREAAATVAFDHFALPLDACGPATGESAGPATGPQAPSTPGLEAPGSAGPATAAGEAAETATGAPAPGPEPPGSPAQGCTVELEVAVRSEGWSAEGEIPWLHPSGAWLRAADVLPSLGHDPDRLVRAPAERRAHGLDPVPGEAPAGALAAAAGVAPAGDWRWSLTFAAESGGASRPAGTRTATSGRTAGPLDFAAAWWPGAPVETRRDGVVALHGPERTRDADGVLDDLAAMRACVAATLGRAPAVGAVLQAPRERGETALYGDLLWLPEHEGWDISGEGFGRWQRRATIAAALASRQLADAAGLRKEPGEDWLRVGVPGWIGLECVRREDGVAAWLALQERASDRVVEAFAALEAPAVGVAAAGDVPWVRHYTPLATVGWGEAVGSAGAAAAVGEVVARVRDGAPLAGALGAAVGDGAAEALLGPPAASDVLVAEAERTLDVAGQRWTWRDGGWEPVAATIHVTRRFDDDGGRERLGPVPTTVDPGDPFTLIDAWPSFERTPADNVWRGGGDD
ncbi:MAG: ABC transporter permease [Acidobacteria bacterium]|nr:ABC transporter permease [Acidobacteriota bacterium]